VDDDNPFKRPNDRADEASEGEQSMFLDDLASLFDEEADESGLPLWDEPDDAGAAEAENWPNSADSAPVWREDAEERSLSDPADVGRETGGSSVFEDSEPTEAVEFPSVDRVDEVLSLEAGAPRVATGMVEIPPPPSAPPPTGANGLAAAGSSLTAAIVVGLLLGGVVLGAIALGERVVLGLLVAALLIAATEWFTALRRAGYQPPTLVGLVAAAVLPLAAYWRGADGMVLVLVFALFGAGLWYLGGVGHDRPLPNLGVTLLGVVYIGVTGAFGGLLLDRPDGAELVLTAVMLTAAHDVGAFAVGRAAGRTPLSKSSPNKTVEGLIGGTILTIATALVFISILEIGPFGEASGSRADGVILGIVVAAVAPLADLLESAFKRDLGVKDMGSLLPGHGGLLDRIDALLFVLPATYFTALMLEVV